MATGQIELQIKRVEFVTAVVVAISVVVGAVVSGVAWLAVKIDNLNNEKPFEGIWQASATYTKLHGISGKWSGTGEEFTRISQLH